MKDNLLHVISKVGYVQFHVVTTDLFCISNIVHTANMAKSYIIKWSGPKCDSSCLKEGCL